MSYDVKDLKYEANFIYWLGSAAFFEKKNPQEFKIFGKKLKFKPKNQFSGIINEKKPIFAIFTGKNLEKIPLY